MGKTLHHFDTTIVRWYLQEKSFQGFWMVVRNGPESQLGALRWTSNFSGGSCPPSPFLRRFPIESSWRQMAMGQMAVPPVNIPIPTKIGSKMVGAPTPKMVPLV